MQLCYIGTHIHNFLLCDAYHPFMLLYLLFRRILHILDFHGTLAQLEHPLSGWLYFVESTICLKANMALKISRLIDKGTQRYIIQARIVQGLQNTPTCLIQINYHKTQEATIAARLGAKAQGASPLIALLTLPTSQTRTRHRHIYKHSDLMHSINLLH